MVLCIIIVEGGISLVWILALDPPRLDTSFLDGKDRVITCSMSHSSKGLALWGCYNAGLFQISDCSRRSSKIIQLLLAMSDFVKTASFNFA